MTDRERWIVYPLLFLALGSALRDKIAKQTHTKQISCEQLVLVDNDGLPLAVLSGKGLEFDRGKGYVKAAAIDAAQLSQFGRPVLTLGPQSISLQQLLQQLLPQMQLAPGLPQQLPMPQSPGQEAPPTDEEPNPGPAAPPAAPGEPAPAA